jgi:hypothetical protein
MDLKLSEKTLTMVTSILVKRPNELNISESVEVVCEKLFKILLGVDGFTCKILKWRGVRLRSSSSRRVAPDDPARPHRADRAAAWLQ